ncbi:helix-turn-helix domain-containing protein [Streptomyces sp. NPDC058657]|uniref:helix-turn-helix domain-containing protein n=1 Tax=unclassified Streptomyces TaxID=2593676 RepID=UPI00365572D0
MPADPFGELLRTLRRKAGHTQEQQAAAINVVSGRETMTRREINRYEHGEHIPTNHTLAYVAVVCGINPEELQREAVTARARRKRRRRCEGEDPDDVKRRTLLGGAIVGASAAAEPWGRLAYALSKGSKIDASSAAALIDRAGALHVSERHLTARELQGMVEAHLDAITAALPRASQHERALTIAAGETAALAGWTAWDLGDHDRARAYYKVTSDCADAAGHPPLRALALAYASYGAATPAKAVECLVQAGEYVRGRGNATAAAWIHGRHAEEAAHARADVDALRALDRARVVYDFAEPASEQPWVQFMTPYRLDSLALSVYGQLGRQELTTTADVALNRLGTDLPESGVVVLGDLAVALLRGGNVDQGVHVTRQFAAATEARPNTMGRERARFIAVHLPDNERELAQHLVF